MNHPTMTDCTSTTWVHEEAKKCAGAVKEIDKTDPNPNDMAFKLMTLFVF